MPELERSVDVLLVGGGVASVRCARAMRRNGFAGSILLVGDEERPPYNRPPLSKELLRLDLPDDLVDAEPDAWYRRRSIDVMTGNAVLTLDPEGGSAVLADGDTIRFGRCLLATGAEPRRLAIPGAEQAMLLRTLSDARGLRSAATSMERGATAAVIGGGFIGLEVASGLAELGLRPLSWSRPRGCGEAASDDFSKPGQSSGCDPPASRSGSAPRSLGSTQGRFMSATNASRSDWPWRASACFLARILPRAPDWRPTTAWWWMPAAGRATRRSGRLVMSRDSGHSAWSIGTRPESPVSVPASRCWAFLCRTSRRRGSSPRLSGWRWTSLATRGSGTTSSG